MLIFQQLKTLREKNAETTGPEVGEIPDLPKTPESPRMPEGPEKPDTPKTAGEETVDMPTVLDEAPRVVVRCAATICRWNRLGYCRSEQIEIAFRGIRGFSSDATECENFSPSVQDT